MFSRIDCHGIFLVKLFDCFYKEDSLAYPNILRMFSRIDCHSIFLVKLFDCFYKEDSLAYPNIYRCFGLVSRINCQVIFGGKLFNCFYKEDSHAYPSILRMFWFGFKDWLPSHFLGQIVWLFLQRGFPCLPQHFTDVLGWFQGLTAKLFFGSNCLTVFTRNIPLLTPTFYGCFWSVAMTDFHDIIWGKLRNCFYMERYLAYPKILLTCGIIKI